jgi:hypothetical protein
MSTEPLPSSAPPFPCSGRREIFSGGGAPRIPLVVASRQRPSPSPGPSLPPRVMEPSRDRSCSSTRACGWRPRRGVREEWAWCMSARPPARIGRRACFRGGAREGKSRAGGPSRSTVTARLLGGRRGPAPPLSGARCGPAPPLSGARGGPAPAPGCPLRPRAGSRVPAARHGRAVGRGVVPRAAAEGREGEIRALAATALPTRRVPSTRAASREGGGRTAGEGGATPAAAAGGSREGAARRVGSPAEGAGLGRHGGATRWRGR